MCHGFLISSWLKKTKALLGCRPLSTEQYSAREGAESENHCPKARKSQRDKKGRSGKKRRENLGKSAMILTALSLNTGWRCSSWPERASCLEGKGGGLNSPTEEARCHCGRNVVIDPAMSRRPALLCITFQAIQWTADAGPLFSRVDHCYASTEPDAMETPLYPAYPRFICIKHS